MVVENTMVDTITVNGVVAIIFGGVVVTIILRIITTEDIDTTIIPTIIIIPTMIATTILTPTIITTGNWV